MYKIFDTHAHYSDRAFNEDRDRLFSEILPENGIVNVVLPGCSVEESESNIKLAEKYDYVYAAAGIHPESVYKKPLDESVCSWLIDICEKKDIKAVGEIGLDYHYEGYNKQWQKDAFRKQIEIAKEFDLPVIVHARDTVKDYLDILEEYRPKGVVHCFSGSRDTAEEAVRLGMYVGFTGVITYKNARKVLEAAAAVPSDRILFETDAPYMTPEPIRSESKFRARCDSTMIPFTAEAAAKLRGQDTSWLLERACENGRILFGI